METRSPFVLGIHDIARRPGTSRTYEVELVAPADLAIEVVRVPEGATIAMDVRLDSVVEGIFASGDLTAPTAGECVRCLSPISGEVTPSFAELFAYPGAIERDPQDEDAEDIFEVSGEEIDIEQVVRDAVVLALPFQPLCKPDCLGLCPQCGIDLNSAPADHHHEVIDARWADLVAAFGEPSREATDEAGDGEAAARSDVP